MNLLEPGQPGRKALLEYGEARALLKIHHFREWRDRQSESEDRWEEPSWLPLPDLSKKLAEFYPGVSFEVRDREILARVQPKIEGTLFEIIGLIKKDSDYLAAEIEYEGYFFQVCLLADGVGIIRELDHYDFILHDLDLDQVREQCLEDEQTIDDYLFNFFEEDGRFQISDQFFDPSDVDDCDIYFERGSQAELDRLMKLFILTEPDIASYADDTVYLNAATNFGDPGLDDRWYYTERLEKLVEIAVEENRPCGWTWEHNDGPQDRESGYDQDPESIWWEIGKILEATCARERMGARNQLRLYLEERGHNPADFGVEMKGEGAV